MTRTPDPAPKVVHSEATLARLDARNLVDELAATVHARHSGLHIFVVGVLLVGVWTATLFSETLRSETAHFPSPFAEGWPGAVMGGLFLVGGLAQLVYVSGRVGPLRTRLLRLFASDPRLGGRVRQGVLAGLRRGSGDLFDTSSSTPRSAAPSGAHLILVFWALLPELRASNSHVEPRSILAFLVLIGSGYGAFALRDRTEAVLAGLHDEFAAVGEVEDGCPPSDAIARPPSRG